MRVAVRHDRYLTSHLADVKKIGRLGQVANGRTLCGNMMRGYRVMAGEAPITCGGCRAVATYQEAKHVADE